MPGNTFGYFGPNRKIAQAASLAGREHRRQGIRIGALPVLTALIAEGFAAERPRPA